MFLTIFGIYEERSFEWKRFRGKIFLKLKKCEMQTQKNNFHIFQKMNRNIMNWAITNLYSYPCNSATSFLLEGSFQLRKKFKMDIFSKIQKILKGYSQAVPKRYRTPQTDQNSKSGPKKTRGGRLIRGHTLDIVTHGRTARRMNIDIWGALHNRPLKGQ